MTTDEALRFIQTGGVLGLMVVILVTGARQIWIWSKVRDDERGIAKERLDEMRRDRDDWKATAQTATTTVSNLTGQVEQLTGVVEKLTATVAAR